MKIPEKTLEEIRKKFETGQNCTSLEKEYGINRKLISHELKQLGFEIRRGYSQQVIKQAKTLYAQGKSISAIAKELGIDRHQLSQNFNRLKIRKTINPKNHTGEFVEDSTTIYIKNEYLAGKSISQLAKQFGRSTNYIYRIINYYGICQTERLNRKYYFDEHIFEKIDTEEKAYWLGFLYADGSINKENGKEQNVEFGLQEQDIESVKAFARFFNANPPIEIHLKKKTKDTVQNTYRVNICSETLCKDLVSHGCMNKKSLILKFPVWLDNSKNLLRHFMRGYFDGDGCIYIRNDKCPQPTFSILGTYDFCSHYNEMLVKYADVNSTKISLRGNIASNAHGGKNQVRKIFEFLYKDATIYMDRKYKKFISLYADKNAV